MIEAEKAFIDTLEDLMKIMENMIKSVSNNLRNNCAADMHTLHTSEENEDPVLSILEKPFQVMTYDKAFEILERHSGNFTSQIKRGKGLGKEHELFLVKYAGDCPVFIIDWPQNIKPFYMKQCKHDTSKVIFHT